MIRLVYISRSNLGGDLGALERLRGQCLRNNSGLMITGVLYYDAEMFMQLLEGHEAKVDPLSHKIMSDNRHHDMRILDKQACGTRLFPQWAMKFVSGFAQPELAAELKYDSMIVPSELELQKALAFLTAA